MVLLRPVVGLHETLYRGIKKVRVEATHRKEGDLGPGSPRTSQESRKRRRRPANSGEELLESVSHSLGVVIEER